MSDNLIAFLVALFTFSLFFGGMYGILYLMCGGKFTMTEEEFDERFGDRYNKENYRIQ